MPEQAQEETQDDTAAENTGKIVNDAGEVMEQADIEDAIAAKEGKAEPEAERPEWLPEKFKTPEELAKSYDALEKTLKEKGRVAPETYEIDESIDIKTDAEALEDFKEMAKAANFNNDQFNTVLRYAQDKGILDFPDYDEEMKKLGSKKDDILNSLHAFATSKLSESQTEVLTSTIYRADQAELLDYIIRSSGSVIPQKLDAAPDSAKSLQSELNELLNASDIKSNTEKQAKATEIAGKLAAAKRK